MRVCVLILTGLLVMGCTTVDYDTQIDDLGEKVDDLQDDVDGFETPQDVSEMLAEMSQQISDLQTQINLADTNIGVLEGRVDDLEAADVDFQDQLDGLHFDTPSYFTVYEGEPIACEVDGYYGYVSTGYVAAGPVVVMTRTTSPSWDTSNVTVDLCAQVPGGNAAMAIVVDGEVMVEMYWDGVAYWNDVEVAIIPLTTAP
jgi:hypothetical protein